MLKIALTSAVGLVRHLEQRQGRRATLGFARQAANRGRMGVKPHLPK
jgi:hypothetical protein